MYLMVTHFKTHNKIFDFVAKCEDLISPRSGNVILESDGIMTSASFSCDVGSTLVGEATPTCAEDGTWTSTSPTCGNRATLKHFFIQFYKLTSDVEHPASTFS